MPQDAPQPMLDTPQMITTDPQPAAIIHVVVPREQIREVMGPGINELHATLAAQGVTPSGPWFTRHHRMQPDVFDFDIGLPVAALVQAQGRMQPGELPATRAAHATYRGPYEGLPAAWAEFDAWIAAQGLETTGALWEVYAVGPEGGADPASYRTELYRPLTG
ncbi:MAG TPA: GyrI-like domain-containing protein [Deinococcales bacterium]|nr:GyrI-like domain-containing protein [Deinococcales bacterium]